MCSKWKIFRAFQTVSLSSILAFNTSFNWQTFTPTDVANWGLGSFAQTFGINAPEAWKTTKGNRGIIVAIIDTGVDYTHPDLVPNLWKNPGELGVDSHGKLKATNGIDDDKNGYIDDVIGWDFVENDNKPFDHHGHGTHIAGIIGGSGQLKTVGVSPEVSLMIIKYYDPKNTGEMNLKNTIRGIHYAIQNGAQIINYSAGGPSFSQPEYEAIKLAESKGILFVSAAGNERQNADVYQYYPASYSLSNILSVTAVDAKGDLLPTSNFGSHTIDIAAPGKNILSSAANQGTALMTGTSQATAFVTGIAVLLMSMKPTWTVQKLKSIILESGKPLKSLGNRTVSGKMVDAAKALDLALRPVTAPKKIVQAKKPAKQSL